MHPLFTLLATRPQLLIDHAQAYGCLFHEEFDESFSAWRRWAMLQAVALCCLSVAIVLGGVAVMLWAVTPPTAIHAPWGLWVMPMAPLGVALVCTALAARQAPADSFGNFGRQLDADLAMLRAADTP